MFDINYNYELDFDVQNEYSCEESGCDLEGICRCREIVGVRLCMHGDFIDSFKIANLMIEKDRSNYVQSALDKYLLERFIRFNINEDSFEPNVGGDYYGEELHGIDLKNAYKLEDDFLNILRSYSEIEKIHKILMLEYGEIAESVQGFNKVTDDWVKREDIILNNENHYSKIEENNNVSVKYNIPVCLCKRVDGRIILIDGYHRFKGLMSEDLIPVIILEKE